MTKGERVVAQTSMGFWIRGTVRDVRSDGTAKVRFGDFDSPPWLPRTQGFGNPEEWVGPERVAPLPAEAPASPPAVDAPVIALWDERRFHRGRVVNVEGEGAEARVDVAFDGWETLPFAVTEVLPIGEAAPDAVARWEERGLALGTPALMLGEDGESRHPGWVAAHGTDGVYLRYERASHGHWVGPDHVKKGGRARERTPPKSLGEPQVGARVVARWTDGQLYDGVVAKRRDGRFVPEIHVCFDDGSERWTPAPRVWVTEEAGPSVPQRERDEPLPDAWLEPGRVVAARAKDGVWRKGTIAARRGTEVWVTFDDIPTRKNRKGLQTPARWVRGPELAFAPDGEDRRFPASRAGVVVVANRKTRHGYEILQLEPGRAKKALGDQLRVTTDGGAERLCPFDDVWPRDDRRAPTSLDGWSRGDAALVERAPGDVEVAEITQLGTNKKDGLLRVRWSKGTSAWVDPARLLERVEPEPEPPPPPPPEPPEPEPVREPAPPPDPAQSLLVQTIQRWSGLGGYRDASLGQLLDDDGRGARLPVDVGLLSVRIARRASAWKVEVTAATGVEDDPAPPPDGATVRLSAWVRSLFARAEDPEAQAERDRAWAAEAFPDAAAEVARAGGALSVSFTANELPAGGTLAAWGRAVHERLFLGDAERQ